MAIIMMIIGFLVLVGSIVWGFNIFDESKQHDSIGLFSDSVSTIHRGTAYTIWIIGGLIGFFFIAVGRIIELLEELVKLKHKSLEKKI
ncbi:hypothetical protein [Cohnella sp. GCM10027633]|uniref:hypothetical protein n=1 Tax=unclassified Cohnella TaxID=2636738 RepID=UPI00363011D0